MVAVYEVRAVAGLDRLERLGQKVDIVLVGGLIEGVAVDDQKIHVHVMLCMIAVTVAEVLRKKVEENGLVYTKEALIEKLATIHDGWIIHELKKADRVVEQLDEEQKKLLDISNALAAS